MIAEAVDGRAKNFLTPAEMLTFLVASHSGRHGVRNHCMMLLAYRHGLRVSELIGLRPDDVDLQAGRVYVRRRKGSLSTEQPLTGDEIRAVRAWLRVRDKVAGFLFHSDRGPFTRQAVNYLCAQIGAEAGLIGVHPHMLRHSCGFALANKGLDSRLIGDWLGHMNPRNTMLYTRTAAHRFEGMWTS